MNGNQDGAEEAQPAPGTPNVKGASQSFPQAVESTPTASASSQILNSSTGSASPRFDAKSGERAIAMFGLLLQGRNAFNKQFRFSVSINVQDFNGAATLHEISSSNDDDQHNNNHNNNNHNNNNFDLWNNAVFDYDFCQSLLGSIQDTGFLDDKNVQTLVEARFAPNNKSNQNGASITNQNKNKIDAATKMIISNSHFFFLAVVSVDASLFCDRIIDVFSRLEVFNDARIAVVAHLLQGRKAFLNNKILENRTDGNAIQQFCCALNVNDLTEPRVFVPRMQLLALKTQFGGEIPKQLTAALVAHQFTKPGIDEEFKSNWTRFAQIGVWTPKQSDLVSALAKEADNSEAIFDVIKNPRVFSICEAIADRWQSHAQTRMMFHRDFSRGTGGFAMSLSDTTGRIFETRHVPMHVMDKSALDFPASSSPPYALESSGTDVPATSTAIAEQCIYIVPGSSGVGKTTSCVCYDPSAPRVFIDSGADIDDSTRKSIVALTKFLHQIEREVQCKSTPTGNSQSESENQRVSEDSCAASTSLSNGSDITAAEIRGIRDGYATLAFLHAFLRTFGEKALDHFNVVHPSFAFADDPAANKRQLCEKILDRIRKVPHYTPNCSTSVWNAMMALFVPLDAIQQCLRLNADFEGTLYVILDEIGECPELVRGLSSCFDDLLDFLKRILFMKSTSKIVFLAAGTGGSRVATRMYGSRSFETGNIRFCTINPNRVFLRNLLHFKSINDARGFFASTLFNLIFAECPLLAVANGSNNDSPNSSLIYSEDKAYKIRSGITAAQFRYVQMVIHNSRCAAIAAKIIDDSFAPTSIVNEIFRQNVQSNRDRDRAANNFLLDYNVVASMLPAWSLFIASSYSQRNSLKMLSLEDKLAVLGQAFRINMTKQLFIDDDVEKKLCVSFGVLEDTAHWIPKGQADETHYHILATDSTGCFHLVCSRQYPRYRISEAFVAFFLTRFGNCSAGIAASVGDAGWDLFEQSAADYQLICLILNCSDHVRNTTIVRDKELWKNDLPPILALYVKHNVHVSGPVYYRKLSNWLAKESGQIPQEEFAFWKKVVQKDGGAIVVINGDCAPFADIVVITKKVIFLTQCKYLSSSSRSKLDFAFEFKKMHTIDSNKKTRALLKGCCEENSEVTFVCIIFTKSDKSNVDYMCTKGNNDAEGFKYEEHIVAAFEEKRLAGAPAAVSTTITNNNHGDDDELETDVAKVRDEETETKEEVANRVMDDANKADSKKTRKVTDKTRIVSTMLPVLSTPLMITENISDASIAAKYARYSPLQP